MPLLACNTSYNNATHSSTPLLTALDMGVLRIHQDKQWSTMALVGGFTMVLNYQVLVNKAERATKIDPDKAQMCFQIAQPNSAKAKGTKSVIEGNLALKRAKARLEALNAT